MGYRHFNTDASLFITDSLLCPWGSEESPCILVKFNPLNMDIFHGLLIVRRNGERVVRMHLDSP